MVQLSFIVHRVEMVPKDYCSSDTNTELLKDKKNRGQEIRHLIIVEMQF